MELVIQNFIGRYTRHCFFLGTRICFQVINPSKYNNNDISKQFVVMVTRGNHLLSVQACPKHFASEFRALE